jgi:RND family efflux transporter MFP subunit
MGMTVTKMIKIVGGFGLVLAVAAVSFWLTHSSTKGAEGEDAASDETPIAPVAKVKRGNIGDTLTIAGAFKPFQEVDVHAKISGYVQAMHVDVGDHVRAGQTLAVLEVPELAAELSGAEASVRRWQEEIHRAQSDVERAQSAHTAAHSAFARLKQAADSRAGLVAQQEIDESQAKDLEAEAQVASAKAAFSSAQQQLEVAEANRKQYSALSNYTQITAPFDGVITTRYADTGALVAAGTSSSAQAMPVVRLAQVSKLRLVLPIPESVAGQIHLRDPVKVHVQALNQDIQGMVSRFADSLDVQTRTMETEMDFENRDGRLMPGMYAETSLSLGEKKNALTVPLEAVTRSGDDATVLAVNAQNTLEERHVKLGLEDNSRVEVLSGLSDQDRVVVGSRSEFRNGQKVQPKEVGSPVSDRTGGK